MAIKKTMEGIPQPMFYSDDVGRDIKKLIEALEESLEGYLEFVRFKGEIIIDALKKRGILEPEVAAELLPVLIDRVGNLNEDDGFRDYTLEVGNMERVWMAARQLLEHYDVAVAVARKGLWLGHIFRLAGWETEELLTLRGNTEQFRVLLPLGNVTDQIRGKRVLILENDMLTGKSIEAVAGYLHGNGVKSADLFLLADHLCLPSEEFEKVKDHVPQERLMGKATDALTKIGREGYMASPGIQTDFFFIRFPEPDRRSIGNVYTASDFDAGKKELMELSWRVRMGPSLKKQALEGLARQRR